MAFWDSFFKDVGIDLGTANSLIYAKREGIVVNEPTFAAVNVKTNQILAVGDEAKKMLNRTPAHISVVRPLVGGVIADFEMTQEYLRQLLRRLNRGTLFRFRRAVLAIPNGLTEVERKSIEDAAVNAGCSRVYLVESPIAAALGAALPLHMPLASLVVDIGGGTTDIAVISMGGTVVSKTLKVAGDKFNDDIIRFIRDEFKLLIGEPTAEFAKITAGSAVPLDERIEIPLRGRDMATGLPREVLVKNSHIRAALAKSLKQITDAAKEVISRTPAELVGDMLRQGIYLTGGGALIKGIDKLIERETMVKTHVVEGPLLCVAMGIGKIVDEFEEHTELLDNPLRPKVIKL
jgi:rod shape-determining protein MreB